MSTRDKERRNTATPAESGSRQPLKAIALGYDRGRENAPRVLAKGGGEVARNILEQAEIHDVPVQRDPDLLQCLTPLEVGVEIPAEAYVAVARVLAFLYRVNAKEQ